MSLSKCSIYLLIICALPGVIPAEDALPRFGLFDELEPLYPDSNLNLPQHDHTISTARGTTGAVHLLMSGLPSNQTLDMTVSLNGKPANKAAWYRLIDVPVEENTGLDSRTEQYTGSVNPYVIRRAPFRVYEPFAPITFPDRSDRNSLALRLEIPVEPDAMPGPRQYDILCKVGNTQQTLTFIVQVYPAIVPSTSHSERYYTNWFSLTKICRDHQLEKWSEPFWQMLEQYARRMEKGRQNTFWFVFSDFFKIKDEMPVLQQERLERYIRLFLNAGFKAIEGAPFARRKGGDWSSNVIEITQTKVPAGSDLGKKQIASMLSQLQSVMQKNGWQSRWMQHIADEPTDVLADDYKKVAEFIHTNIQGVPIIDASMSIALTGGIDIWCPQVQEYQKHRTFFEQRQADGDQVWVYTCLVPGGRWLNRLLDQERLRPVYLGWSLVKYDLGGFLHWGLNHHHGNPFEQSVVQHPQGADNNHLPAGDTHILYPGKTGPLSSVRFEAHRIGMEDAELLAQLKARSPEQYRIIMNMVLRAFDDYETDVTVYRKAKTRLLNTLENSIRRHGKEAGSIE